MSGRTGSWAGSVLPVFVGHDSREPEATSVCTRSLVRRASIPLHVQLLHEPSLRQIGLYYREWYLEEGRKVDSRDHKPFSTAFSFTRFLVPALMQYRGPALFCDSDFLFLADIDELAGLFDPSFAVQVVKHQHCPAESVKMDGQAQQPYWRKNWSSLVLWNCAHPSNQKITPREVNRWSGQWLHGFSWLDDDEIGDLPRTWNHLVSVDADEGMPKAAHFTLGIPGMPDRPATRFDQLWRDELAL